MTSHNTNVYAPMLKAWPVKQLGPKPSDELLATAHAFGRAGKQSLALAMAMRDCGVTQGQIQIACGAPQNNHRIGLVRDGTFKRDMGVPKTEAGHTVYRIVLTPKGEQRMKRTLEAKAKAGDGAEPVKAKVKRTKAAKRNTAAKGAAADTATVEQVTTQVNTPAVTAEQPQA